VWSREEGASGLTIALPAFVKTQPTPLSKGSRALVGSINFAAGSLDTRRELAIEVRDEDVVDRLHKIVRHDREHSHAMDLSDEGLLADLDGRIDVIAKLLAINVKRVRRGKRVKRARTAS
jgi:cardiolipin synthase